jgi:hypothetical protein
MMSVYKLTLAGDGLGIFDSRTAFDEGLNLVLTFFSLDFRIILPDYSDLLGATVSAFNVRKPRGAA